MMKRNLLTIWAKRAIPALALAGTAGLTLPSCEKEPIEQHDEEILYYKNNNNNLKFSLDTLQKYSVDKSIRNIYITVAPGEVFTSLTSTNINVRKIELQLAKSIAPRKVLGRGNFVFTPGECAYSDSLDFVAMGFTVNQQNQR